MDTKTKSKTLDLTALLACAFARNKKMSRFIAEKYAVDRDAFFRYAEDSPQYQSRYVQDADAFEKKRIIQALGVIRAYFVNGDEELGKEILSAARKSFHKLSKQIEGSKKKFILSDVVESKMLYSENSGDARVLDQLAVAIFLANGLGIRPSKEDESYVDTMKYIFTKNALFTTSFSKIIKDELGKNELDSQPVRRVILDKFKNVQSLSRIWLIYDEKETKQTASTETMKFVAELAGVPTQNYDCETFSGAEMDDLFSIFTLFRKPLSDDEMMIMYPWALALMSLGRAYKKAANAVLENSPDMREDVSIKELKGTLSSEIHANTELRALNKQKQQDLNRLQLELEKQSRKIESLDKEAEEKDEEIAVLKAALQQAENESEEEDSAEYEALVADGKRVKAILFGGPPKWQALVHNEAESFKCIPVESKGFPLSVIDDAEVVVFKTDYLSHAQWSRVMNRVKGKPIVYCGNHLETMFARVAMAKKKNELDEEQKKGK